MQSKHYNHDYRNHLSNCLPLSRNVLKVLFLRPPGEANEAIFYSHVCQNPINNSNGLFISFSNRLRALFLRELRVENNEKNIHIELQKQDLEEI